MSKDRPYIITFIGDMSILSAFALILSLFPNFKDFVKPLPNYSKVPLPEDVMTGLIAIVILITSYGYLKLKRWGYWLMASVNLYFLVGWIISYKQIPILVIIDLIFFLPTIKYFSEKKLSHNFLKI